MQTSETFLNNIKTLKLLLNFKEKNVPFTLLAVRSFSGWVISLDLSCISINFENPSFGSKRSF